MPTNVSSVNGVSVSCMVGLVVSVSCMGASKLAR